MFQFPISAEYLYLAKKTRLVNKNAKMSNKEDKQDKKQPNRIDLRIDRTEQGL
jgi:hypothetical protein